jgi:hypothetical protein
VDLAFYDIGKTIQVSTSICSLNSATHVFSLSYAARTILTLTSFLSLLANYQLMGEEDSMCANADLPMARDACCRNPEWNQPGAYSKCYHSFERTTFQTAKDRCEDNICSWYWIYSKGEQACQYNSEDAWYWTTDEACSLHVKG